MPEFKNIIACTEIEADFMLVPRTAGTQVKEELTWKCWNNKEYFWCEKTIIFLVWNRSNVENITLQITEACQTKCGQNILFSLRKCGSNVCVEYIVID